MREPPRPASRINQAMNGTVRGTPSRRVTRKARMTKATTAMVDARRISVRSRKDAKAQMLR